MAAVPRLFVGGPRDGERFIIDGDPPFHPVPVLREVPSICPPAGRDESLPAETVVVVYERVRLHFAEQRVVTYYRCRSLSDSESLVVLLERYPSGSTEK